MDFNSFFQPEQEAALFADEAVDGRIEKILTNVNNG